MNWNRNHYMTVGFLMILAGFHFRVIESFVLTPQATKFLHEQQDGLELTGSVYKENGEKVANQNSGGMFLPQYQTVSQSGRTGLTTAGYTRSETVTDNAKKIITPPTWMGWPMIYIGAVLALFGMTTSKTS
ncbi:MAG: hypothetical protein Q8M16_17160 [Pirellulaceae bacterium]|nr:hypothetical protein [Pirellulaceae bacterium]